jgi:hypothetical protein
MFDRLLIIIIFVIFTVVGQAQSSERDGVLRLLGESYNRVADEAKVLFELDRFHVIRAEFDKRNKLTELAVEPKYYFEAAHPDWRETIDFKNLSRAEFLSLSEKLKRVKDIGKVVKQAKSYSGVTSNTAWYTEYYSKATLAWGAVAGRRDRDDSPYEVRWFRFQYRKHTPILDLDPVPE